MSFFKKLFGKKDETPSPDKPAFSWIAAADNEWGLPLLDLRIYAAETKAFSQAKQMAINAASFRNDDGTSFTDQKPDIRQFTATDINIPTIGLLPYGMLFCPDGMDQKWAIFFHQDEIIFVRSWLRKVYVRAQTIREQNNLHIKGITGSFSGEENAEDIIAVFLFLLQSHALHTISPAPLPPELAANSAEAAHFAFSSYGNLGQLGVFTPYHATITKPLRTHTLLHIAVVREDVQSIHEQLQLGTDINCLDTYGLAPLHFAPTVAISQLLLSLGADIEVPSLQGNTPLMDAVQSNHKDKVLFLLEAGANVNAGDARGFTALHKAAEMGHTDITHILLKNGADKHIVTAGYTATSLAEMQQREDILKLLQEHP